MELVIANRRGRGAAKGREVTKEDRDNLIASIRTFAKALDGVKEWKKMAEVVTKHPAEQEGEVEMVRRKPKAVTVMLFFESTQSEGASNV